MTARDTLDQRLVAMASRGERPRCGEPADRHLWLSDSPDDRRRAAALCRGCPLLGPCAEAAEELDERFGTWSGRDRTRHPTTQSRPRAKPGPRPRGEA